MQKPYPDFPLTPHPSGQWVKRIRGKLRYFGRDAEKALNKYLDQRDDLQAGREPRREGITVKQLVNQFLNVKHTHLKAGDIKQRTFDYYEYICLQVVDQFGKGTRVESLQPADFAALHARWAKTRGPVSRLNDITRTRILFKFAYDQGLIAAPLKFGQGFKRPSATTLRASRQKRLYSAREVRVLVEAAQGPLKAMVLLGINCGFGNTDCAKLKSDHLDLGRGWVDYPRPKTAVPRRAKLWPETVEAIRTVMHDGVVFRTERGCTWECERYRAIGKAFGKLARGCGIEGSFYALRHTFFTVAEPVDAAAADFVMGHAPSHTDMRATYREQMDAKRLFRVAKAVRTWYLRA